MVTRRVSEGFLLLTDSSLPLLGERQTKIYQQLSGWHALRYEGRVDCQSTFAIDTTPIAIALSVPPVSHIWQVHYELPLALHFGLPPCRIRS